MNMKNMILEWVPGTFAVVQLSTDAPIPEWILKAEGFTSITRTKDELSIVCGEEYVPEDALAEKGWVALCLSEPIKFSEIGILAKLTATLADADVSLFAISTYQNDILLTKSSDSIATRQALAQVCDVSRL
jgi:uncharacterized protein